MKECMETQWELIINYKSKISMLLVNWFCDHFLYSEDAEKIFHKPSLCGRNFLCSHRCYVGVKPLYEISRRKIIWVKLSGLPLPLELGTRNAMVLIDDMIGNLFFMDESSFCGMDKRIAWL